MRQFIAPQVITVNGKISPCECTDTVICSYCVHANMVLWEREEIKAGNQIKKPKAKKRRKPI
jgi:hypothetical protein